MRKAEPVEHRGKTQPTGVASAGALRSRDSPEVAPMQRGGDPLMRAQYAALARPPVQAPAPGAPLRIHVCGPLRVEAGERRLDSANLTRWHVRGLLALLAAAPAGRVDRDDACEVLWPDSPARAARNRLYHTVLLLKRTLVEFTHDLEWVRVDGGQISLLEGVWTDAGELRDILQRRDWVAAEKWLLEQAGPMQPFAPWLPDVGLVTILRAELEAARLEVLHGVVGQFETNEDTPARRRLLEHLLRVAPADELAQRALMELDLRAGRAHLVLRRYEQCARTMAELHGLKPSSATVELAARATHLLRPGQGRGQDEPAEGVAPSGPAGLPIIGREALVVDLSTKLIQDSSSVTTLVGSGGIGKTRVAREAALRLTGAFADGIYWFDLSPYERASDVLALMIRTLRVGIDADSTGAAPLSRVFDARQMLVVLDNAEQVDQLASLLRLVCTGAQRTRVLVTSRVPLELPDEHVLLVPPLALPAASAPATELESSPAVQLFLQRAPSGPINTDRRLRDIASLVLRLDGLPLAIEIAAARAAINTPAEMISQLDYDLQVLDHGPVDGEQRHRSMSAVLDWTARSLSADAASVYQIAAVPADAFDMATLAALASGFPRLGPMEPAISDLVHAGLLEPTASDDGMPRWRMLQLPRRHAATMAAAAGVLDQMRDRHLGWVARTIGLIVERRWDTSQAAAADEIDRLEAETTAALLHANRSALGLLAPLVADLGDYWLLRSEVAIGERWCNTALDVLAHAEQETRSRLGARIGVNLARLLLAKYEIEPASRAAQQAFDFALSTADDALVADAVETRVAAAARGGDLAGAAKLATHWLDRLGDHRSPAYWRLAARRTITEAQLGTLPTQSGAHPDFKRLSEELGGTQTWLLLGLGEWVRQYRCGQWATAHAVSLQAVQLAAQLRSPHWLVAALVRQALCECGLDLLEQALAAAHHGRTYAERCGLIGPAAAAAMVEVDILARTGRIDQAEALLDQYAQTMQDPARGSLRPSWQLLAGLIAYRKGDVRAASEHLVALVGDERMFTGATTIVLIAELALVIAIEQHNRALAAQLLGIINLLDTARIAPRKPLERRWLDAQTAGITATTPTQSAGEVLSTLQPMLQDLGAALAIGSATPGSTQS